MQPPLSVTQRTSRAGVAVRLWRVLRGLLVFIGFTFLIVSFTPLVTWWGGELAGNWDNPRGEIMIVLAGDKIAPDILGLSSYWRCVYALRFYQEGGVEEIVVTGKDIAPAMRDFLAMHGVPASIVRIENAATSTRENALFTAQMLAGDPRSKILVTSDYHMYRAVRCFRNVGLGVLERPLPDARKRASRIIGRWPAFLDLVVETGKIAYYYARGWI